MGYNVRVESYFSAAHNLRGYQGKCENVHGHNWKVEVKISSDILDKTGMVIDFTDVKAMLAKITSKLDHKQLNKLSYFKKKNPTSENIAEFIYGEFKKNLKQKRHKLESVSVWETPTSCATFYL
ncbi:6-carboxytetrahydropterin synthase QueD [Candidatus Omnitrophota bacterium]